jgi:hypothetical protein
MHTPKAESVIHSENKQANKTTTKSRETFPELTQDRAYKMYLKDYYDYTAFVQQAG